MSDTRLTPSDPTITSECGTSKNNRRARVYSITRAGRRQLIEEQETGASRGEYHDRGTASSPTIMRRSPLLSAGDPAPPLTLPAINRLGAVSLEDYRGQRAVLIAILRGLHCPFCRRQIVQLSAMQPQLAEAGVEMLAVINTPLERAQLYFQYRPSRVILLADPGAVSHRAFGVPAIEFAPGGAGRWPLGVPMEQFASALVNPTGELPRPVSPFEANATLNAMDGFEPTAVDEQIFASHGTQLVGHFLIDRSGIIRWTHVEAPDGPSQIGVLPNLEAVLGAVRHLPPGS